MEQSKPQNEAILDSACIEGCCTATIMALTSIKLISLVRASGM